jgi:NodT family efflux transporter outer membrane factor (OMF) lipoprotein
MTAGPFPAGFSRRLLLAAALALAGCTMHAPLKSLPAPADTLAFAKSAGGSETGQWPEREWWSGYGDAQLSALIKEALASSPDMEVALARLSAAEARAAGTGAALSPIIDATAGAQRSRFSANGLFPPPIGGSTVWQNKASFDFRWELDLWGKHRSALSAALKETEAARLDRDIAELTLSTAIARRYVEWQRLEDQLAIGRSLLEQRTGLLSLTQKRVDAGLDSNVQLRAAEAAVPDTRADLAALETQVAIARVELAALLGAGPDRSLDFSKPALSPPAFSGTPTLLPADLLARRPDVIARQLRVAAAAARADAAQADFYPNINLAASLGLDSTTFENWIEGGSRFYNAGPAINLPVWGGGRRRATLNQRTAEYDEAAAMYRQTLVGATRDVAAALTDLRSIDAEERDALAAVAAQTQSHALAERRYAGGLGTSTEVLIAEASLLNQRRRIADLSARRLDASIRLVAALGGGIPVEAATAAARP